MPKTDIKVYASDGNTGNKTTATISYVNPEASNSVLKAMAQKLNALTTNTYISTDRVETIEVDTDTSRKAFRNLQFSNASQGATTTITFTRTENEEATPIVFFYSNDNVQRLTTTNSSTGTVGKITFTTPSQTGTIFAGISEKTEFYSEFIRTNV